MLLRGAVGRHRVSRSELDYPDRDAGATATRRGRRRTFLKGAIMGSIARRDGDVRIRTAGVGSEPAIESLRSAGFTVEPLGDDVTRPAALKMLRSLMTKNLRTLAAETLLAARAYVRSRSGGARVDRLQIRRYYLRRVARRCTRWNPGPRRATDRRTRGDSGDR